MSNVIKEIAEKKSIKAVKAYVKQLLKTAVLVPGTNNMYYVEIDPRMCVIDPRYQTNIRVNRRSKLYNNWDPFRCLPIQVNFRDDKELLIIDGYHRCEAAIQLGIEKIPCYLYLGLTFEDEARLFVMQNTITLTVSPKEIWFALLGTGSPKEVMLHDIFNQYGFDVYDTPGRHAMHSITAIKSIMDKSENMTLDECQDWANWLFGVLRSLHWGGLKDATSDIMLCALTNVYITHHADDTLPEATVNLINFMSFIDPVGIKKLAVATCDTSSSIRNSINMYLGAIADGSIYQNTKKGRKARNTIRDLRATLVASGLMDPTANPLDDPKLIPPTTLDDDDE